MRQTREGTELIRENVTSRLFDMPFSGYVMVNQRTRFMFVRKAVFPCLHKDSVLQICRRNISKYTIQTLYEFRCLSVKADGNYSYRWAKRLII